MNLTIRKYGDYDKEAVIKLLKLNTPAFFSPSEEADLIYYLDNESENYYLLTIGNDIYACGGINFIEKENIAKISWDMVHPQSHRKGYGSLLLDYRIAEIRKFPHIKQVIVRTSQLVYPFYEKFGFKLSHVVKDYWAVGFDLYQMERNLGY